MRKLCPCLLLVAACVVVFSIPARCQDEAPSLGDVARKSRLQKQQKDAGQKDTQTGKEAVPTNSPAMGTQSKDVSSKDPAKPDTPAPSAAANSAATLKKAKKVITNEELPEHVGPTRTLAPGSAKPDDYEPEEDPGDGKAPADYWRTRILSQKNSIAAMKSDIDTLSASIQYAPGNCVSGCVEWNERQQQKQQQVDAMKSQLEQLQTQLEDMQEMARKQGYGSSVYDP